MSSEIQELIDKIKNDGIQNAEKKASEIEKQAKDKADELLRQAQQKADDLIAQANSNIKKLEESAQKSLQQASRDVLLSLRKEIQNTLQRLVSNDVTASLTSDQLGEILADVIKKTVDGSAEQGVVVEIGAKDLKKLSDGFVAKLQKAAKKEIKIQSSDDMSGGFTISYDDGKSSFDFSDESLTQYLSTYLNNQLSELLNQS